MKTVDKSVQDMNVDELVAELMEHFSAIHKQLNIIEIQTSHQNKKLLNLETKVNSTLRSLTRRPQAEARSQA